MNKPFGVPWLGTWVSDIIPDPVFRLGKRTPWYASTRLRTVPWMAVAFIAPFAVLLLWKGVAFLLPKSGRDTQSSANQPPTTNLT